MDISLQLYSIREDEEENFDNALAMCAKAGYQGVEFAQYFGNSPDQMKALLKKHGLKAVSTHAGFDRFKKAFDEEIKYAETLNYKLIVCPGIGAESAEQIAADAKYLEECAKKAAKKGITIGYHNHSHEFKKFGGKYALDILLENAPSVKFEADVCWVANAGVDPVAYITPLEKAGRMCAIHAKELGRNKETDVYIGEGVVDFAAIAKVCPPAKYPWIVEQEGYHSSRLDGITVCYKTLTKILGGK